MNGYLVGVIIGLAFLVGIEIIWQAKKRRQFAVPLATGENPPYNLLSSDVVGIIRVQKQYLGSELTPTAETYDLLFTHDRAIVADLKYPFAMTQVPAYTWDNYIGKLKPKELSIIHLNDLLKLEKFSILYKDIEKVEIKRVRSGGGLRIVTPTRKYNFALKGIFRNPQRFEDYVSILLQVLPQKTLVT